MNLGGAYSQDDFLSFLRGFLPEFSQDLRPLTVPQAAKTVQSGHYLGRSAALDLDVFELEHGGGQEKRIALTTDGFRVMKDSASFQALAVFRSTDTDQWRLSLMTATPEVGEDGKIITRLSNPKRYSFLLGPGAKTNTPSKFLIDKGSVSTIDELKERFSIEVVNKDFYREIAKFFSRLTGGDIKVGSKKEHFDPELELPIESGQRTTHQEFAVRLIGRVIFSWFLKQKKSEAGVPLLPEAYLSKTAVETNSGYYHMVLEKIFFEAMNKPLAARRRDLPSEFDQIPFLNGGLFDPHTDDFYTDGQFNGAVKIPDEWFHDLFEVLETYNFTIDENTVLDVDLSIDPEMLGRIFENLLAEINPDTGESARKATGSYYTPRQIVEYMVDQSLIQYLLSKTGIAEEKLKALASVDELDDETHPLDDAERRKVIDALDEVKIIDPACGSGAFPIGILQKIVFMLGRTDPEGRLWFAKKTEGLDPILQDDFKKKFANENFDYIRKTGIIRDSIYGVDIQPIAVEVSKLRCFLTLIVDEDIDDAAENRGIKPLPNLEFKFVAANTLVKLPGTVTYSISTQQTMFEEEGEIEQLKKIRDRYFVSTGYEKSELRSKFKDIQRRIFKNQISRGGAGQMSMALADWDPFENKVSSWFDPEWMFGITNGFDIAIANPPYVRIQTLEKESKTYLKEHYDSAAKGNYDLYVVFVERGLQLLNKNGQFSYILPSKFFNAQYGQPLRNLLSQHQYLKQVVDFGDQQVFPGATNYVCLLFLSKSGARNCRWVKIDDIFHWLATFNSPQMVLSNGKFSDEEWNIAFGDEGKLLTKLQQMPSRLRDVTDRISQGIRTSANEVYVLDATKEHDDILIAYSRKLDKSVELERGSVLRFLQGREVKAYTISPSGKYVINPYVVEGNKLTLLSPKQYASLYPKTWAYLEANRDYLESRENGRMKRPDWYGFIYPKNLEVMRAPKLVVPDIASRASFAYDEEGDFAFTSGYGITLKPAIKESPKYFLALLNSRLLNFVWKNISTPLRGGFYRYFSQYIEQLPIHEIKHDSAEEYSKYQTLVGLVDKIIARKKADREVDTTDLEKEIDKIVYELYGLTAEEIKIIEHARS